MDFTTDVKIKPIKASNHDEINFGKGVLLSISTNGKPDYDFSKHEHPSDIIFIMQRTWSYSALLFHIWGFGGGGKALACSTDLKEH